MRHPAIQKNAPQTQVTTYASGTLLDKEPVNYSFDPMNKRVRLFGWISSQEEASEAISYIEALKGFLPTGKSPEPVTTRDPSQDDNNSDELN